MCGIVAYVGGREAAPLIIKGLKRLEYRGYDSAGIALLDGDALITHILSKISAFPYNTAFIVITTDFEVGVLLISAKLSIGTKTLASGK